MVPDINSVGFETVAVFLFNVERLYSSQVYADSMMFVNNTLTMFIYTYFLSHNVRVSLVD